MILGIATDSVQAVIMINCNQKAYYEFRKGPYFVFNMQYCPRIYR